MHTQPAVSHLNECADGKARHDVAQVLLVRVRWGLVTQDEQRLSSAHLCALQVLRTAKQRWPA